MTYAIVKDAKASGLPAGSSGFGLLHRQAALQEFTDGRGAARHPMGKSPVVQCAQFIGIQHDLQTLGPIPIGHRQHLFVRRSRSFSDRGSTRQLLTFGQWPSNL
jgi:hypothetical protein